MARFSMLRTWIVHFKVDFHWVSSSHPTSSLSGRRGYVTGVCQLVYLILDICGGAVKVEVVDTTGAMVAFRLLTNMGSKQATLAAKNAWMQWRTAKRLENSSSWKHQGGEIIMKVCWRKGGSLKQKSNQTCCMKVLTLTAYRGEIIKQEIHLNALYFYLLPSAISFALARLWRFEKFSKNWGYHKVFDIPAIWKCWRLRNNLYFHKQNMKPITTTKAKSKLTFASISFVSGFWNRNLILLFPSSDDPLSWENLYLHSTTCNESLNYAY